jgi:flagellar protein FliO/FliZ
LNAIARRCLARPTRMLCGLAALACSVSQLPCALAAAPFAAPEQVAASSSTGGLLRVVVALLLVLGAVIAAGRFARRVRGISGGTSSALEVVGQLPLGTRERAVLIRVGERQLLIGVAPGSVRTLHVFDDAPVARDSTVAQVATAPSFKALLLKSLGK